MRKYSSDIRNNSRKETSMTRTGGEMLGDRSLESISQNPKMNITSDNLEAATMCTPLHLLVDRQVGSSLGTKEFASDF